LRNLNNRVAEEFTRWRKRFEGSERGRAALAHLDREFPEAKVDAPVSLFGRSLRSAVLRACFSAAHVNPADDSDHVHRRDNQAALRELASQGKAVKTLRRFLKRRSLAAMFVTAYASVVLISTQI